MAENRLKPDDTALYFCTSRAGESRLQRLALDPYGRITNWPEGFFGDEFGEIAATEEAIISRELNGAA